MRTLFRSLSRANLKQKDIVGWVTALVSAIYSIGLSLLRLDVSHWYYYLSAVGLFVGIVVVYEQIRRSRLEVLLRSHVLKSTLLQTKSMLEFVLKERVSVTLLSPVGENALAIAAGLDEAGREIETKQMYIERGKGSLIGTAWSEKQTFIYVPVEKEETDSASVLPYGRWIDFKGSLCIPLIDKDSVVGVLVVKTGKWPSYFDAKKVLPSVQMPSTNFQKSRRTYIGWKPENWSSSSDSYLSVRPRSYRWE